MRFFALAALAAVCGCATPMAPHAAVECPAEQALYHMRHQPGTTLRILATPHALNASSNLAARVEFESEAYWFAFTSSLGYSRTYIGRTEDPFQAAAREDSGKDVGEEHREPDYDGSELTMFDRDFNVIENVPSVGDPAPAHLLASGVSSAIWYSLPRRELKRELWDLVACVDDNG